MAPGRSRTPFHREDRDRLSCARDADRLLEPRSATVHRGASFAEPVHAHSVLLGDHPRITCLPVSHELDYSPRREGMGSPMTIPYVGRCIGSGEPAREGSVEGTDDSETGVCVACSGRFNLRSGVIVEHETATEDEREALSE